MKRNRESGQAMLELTIMLLAFAAMILGLVVLGGIEITGNKLLLSARRNAQEMAVNKRGNTVSTVSGAEYVSWNFALLDLKKKYRDQSGSSSQSTGALSAGSAHIFRNKRDYYISANREAFKEGLRIPFTLGGSSYHNSENNSLNNSGSGFSSPLYSEKYDERGEEYIWKPLYDFSNNGFKSDFVSNSGGNNALDAANLLSASGTTGNSPATLNRYDQTGAYSADDALYVMYDTFRKLFGIKINKIRLSEAPSNQVYMPVLK